jgi:hypothetical protein
MDVAQKLVRLCDAATDAGRSELDRHTARLARVVAGVLRDGSWDSVSAKVDKELSEAAEDARAAARLHDAAEYIVRKVLSAPNGKAIDTHLKPDLRAVQEQIVSLFEEVAAPERGFVYVAWSKKPEKYYYVGKASNAGRLNLAAHGKLARATAHATQLSLLFPTQSREEILLALEASVIELIEFHTGDLPDLNDNRGTVPDGAAVVELKRLSEFLGSVATDVHDA